MSAITITQASPDEAPILKQIAIAAKRYWHYADHLIEQWAATPIITAAAIERDLVFTARVDKQPIGWYRLIVDRRPAILEDLWVTPAWIGHGIGRALLTHAATECRARGIEQIELESDPNATGFYLRMGGMVIGERMSEWKRLVPLIRITLVQQQENAI